MEISCEEVWREISNYLEGESALLSIGLEGEERSSKWVRAPSTIEDLIEIDLGKHYGGEAPESRTERNVKQSGHEIN